MFNGNSRIIMQNSGCYLTVFYRGLPGKLWVYGMKKEITGIFIATVLNRKPI